MIKAISMLGNTEAPVAPTSVTKPQETPQTPQITPAQDTFVPSAQITEAPPKADPNDKFVKKEETTR